VLHKLLPVGYHLTGALLSTNKDVCASLVKHINVVSYYDS